MPTDRLMYSEQSRVVRTFARSSKSTWFLAIIFFALTTAASAQLYTGSIAGTVTDQTSAVIPGVKITAIDSEKGFSFTAATDQQGSSPIAPVAPW